MRKRIEVIKERIVLNTALSCLVEKAGYRSIEQIINLDDFDVNGGVKNEPFRELHFSYVQADQLL